MMKKKRHKKVNGNSGRQQKRSNLMNNSRILLL